MELANLWRGGLQGGTETAVIRTATEQDAADIYQLLRRATHSHLHAGWHLPIHWLGRDEFLVYEPLARKSSALNKLWGEDVALRACLVATANPAPTAWVHVAALRGVEEPIAVLGALLLRVEEVLSETAVSQIAWMPVDSWPDEWLLKLGFTKVNQVQTYFKQDMILPDVRPVPNLAIRSAIVEDIPTLADIEVAAYEPLWRHSLADLSAALLQAFSFDVALLNNQLVGFQLSTCDGTMAHLARLTISPIMHKRGVGSALLAHAIQGYRQQDLQSVSLNTQVDNIASQQLYKKFSFVTNNQRFPIWLKQL